MCIFKACSEKKNHTFTPFQVCQRVMLGFRGENGKNCKIRIKYVCTLEKKGIIRAIALPNYTNVTYMVQCIRKSFHLQSHKKEKF